MSTAGYDLKIATLCPPKGLVLRGLCSTGDQTWGSCVQSLTLKVILISTALTFISLPVDSLESPRFIQTSSYLMIYLMLPHIYQTQPQMGWGGPLGPTHSRQQPTPGPAPTFCEGPQSPFLCQLPPTQTYGLSQVTEGHYDHPQDAPGPGLIQRSATADYTPMVHFIGDLPRVFSAAFSNYCSWWELTAKTLIWCLLYPHHWISK